MARCSRDVKPEKPVMWRTAAYVDINAWSAGIVEKAEDYEWCSFAAADPGLEVPKGFSVEL